MPTLDEIFQTGEPVSKTEMKTLWPSPSGETGVLNPGYEIGDVRRYGVFPDGVTNWENDHLDRVTAIYANSCLPEITVRWPAGDYATSLNMDDTYNGSKMYFDRADFYGILHVLGASGVRWMGDMGSYDRLGCSTGTRDAQFGIVRMLHDPAKNISGTGNRGVHFLGCSDIRWDLIVVDNTGAVTTPAPGDQNIWSAFTIQSVDPSAVGGELGYRFKGNKVWVKNSQGHGSYINAEDVDIGELIIDGFGNQAIDFVSSSFLNDADSEAQSEVGAGLWLNRWTGRIGRVQIRQGNASPANDVYTLLIDETGRTPGPGRAAMGRIGELSVEVGGTNNRGVNFGAIISPSFAINCRIDSLIVELKSGLSMATGYGMCNINPSATTADSKFRVSVGKFTVVSGGAATQWKVTGGTGTRVNIDLGIESWTVNTMAAGRLLVVDSSAQADVVSGRIGRIEGTYAGGSSSSPLIQLTSARNFHIGPTRVAPDSPVSTPGALFTGCTDCSHDIILTGLNGNYGVTLDTTTRFRLSGRIEGNAGNGTGIIFTGTNVDISLRDISVTGCAKGFDNGAGMAFTRGAAVNVSAVSNTAATDLTTSDFPAANQLGCTDFAV